jgi:hypothetical protein
LVGRSRQVDHRGSYHDIEQALLQALQEIRHYIDNGVQLY